jgi:competence protein ComEC
VEKIKGALLTIRYIAIINQIGTRTCSGMLNIHRDICTAFETGTLLRIKGALQNKLPNNPNQFDYGEYLKKKICYTLTWIRSALVPYLKDIWYYAAITNNDYSKLREEQFPQKELNVAVALILGQKQDLSPDILQDYQYAGAIHILSVSGLHVGFLLLFFDFYP